MTTVAPTNEARRLLLAHADRAVTGPLDDPAVVAAVIGVERLVVATGSTDRSTLQAAIRGRLAGARAPDVAALVEECERQVRAGLARRETGQGVDAGVVNADAGSHPVVTDAVLLRAAVRAGQQSYDAMPYYRVRYGERGARFASSDSAWLVSLAQLPQERAVHHVHWLAGVLAARGMPSWLLETHLERLVSEVAEAGGEDAAGTLPAAAASLASTRRRFVDDDLLALADTWVDDALGDAVPVPRTGALMAAAVADVRAGVTLDDSSLVDWLEERVGAAHAPVLREVGDRIRQTAG